MKKQFLCICLLVTGIFAAAVSDTTAIYSRSFLFNFQATIVEPEEPDRPIHENDFLKYEMKSIYNESKVTFDELANTVTVKGEAGAMKTFDNKTNLTDYEVTATFKSIMPEPAELKNLGLVFNGSHSTYGADQQGHQKQAISYVLKFDNNGNMLVTEQGFANYTAEGDDHYESSEFASVRHYPLLTADKVSEFIQQHNIDLTGNIKLDVKVNKNTIQGEQMVIFIFINDHIVNPEGLKINHDYRINHSDGGNVNNMVGMSTYQTKENGTIVSDPAREILVSDLYVKEWDYQAEVDAGQTIHPNVFPEW